MDATAHSSQSIINLASCSSWLFGEVEFHAVLQTINWSWWIWTHLIAFLSGAAFLLAMLIIICIIIFYWLPIYPSRQQTNPSSSRSIACNDSRYPLISEIDPHLMKSGWLRISFEPLAEQELYDHAWESDNPLNPIKTRPKTFADRIRGTNPFVFS